MDMHENGHNGTGPDLEAVGRIPYYKAALATKRESCAERK
jgi:hypothetical protein